MIDKAHAAKARELNRQGKLPLLMPSRPALLMRLACAFRRPEPVGAARCQLAVLPALEAGRHACLAPRLASNIVLAGEVGLQADLHGTGHGPASASRAGHLSMGSDRRGHLRRSSHP